MLPTHRRRPPVEGAKPPKEVRFTELRVEPWPDGTRVRVHLSLTPFQDPPNLEAVLSEAHGPEITRAAIIENVDEQIVFTMHIRTPAASGAYALHVVITYPDIGTVDERSVAFTNSQISGGDS
jgi:hypothetical protein